LRFFLFFVFGLRAGGPLSRADSAGHFRYSPLAPVYAHSGYALNGKGLDLFWIGKRENIQIIFHSFHPFVNQNFLDFYPALSLSIFFFFFLDCIAISGIIDDCSVPRR
jgi:hypothetical protein